MAILQGVRRVRPSEKVSASARAASAASMGSHRSPGKETFVTRNYANQRQQVGVLPKNKLAAKNQPLILRHVT
jgi:hypothetical protein